MLRRLFHKSSLFSTVLMIFVGLAWPQCVQAVEHPVSVIKAKAFINPDRMSISYEVVYADDLELFHGLEVDRETQLFDEDELGDAIEEHGKFLRKNIQVADVDGQILKGRLTNVIDIEVPEEGLPAGSLMEYSLLYTYEFKFDQPPQFLTFQHLIDDAQFPNPVEIDITLKQAGAKPPFPRFGLRFNQPVTREFSWENIDAANQNEVDQWLTEDPEPGTVGVEGFSSTYSFIYITEYEVRHELLIPLSSLDEMIGGIERKDPLYLSVEEQDALIPEIKSFFDGANPVEVDGQLVIPRFDRIDFFDLRTRDFGMGGIRKKVSMLNGRVGIILSYSTKGLADEIRVQWEMFSDALKQIDSVVIAFDEVSRFLFARFKSAEFKEKDENILVWKNPGVEENEKAQPVSQYVERLRAEQRALRCLPLIVSGFLFILGIAAIAAWARTSTQSNWLLPARIIGIAGLGCVMVTPLTVFNFGAIGGYLTRSQVAVNDEAAAEIFTGLHKNMFRAFDYHDEEDVYDSLAASVDGALLSDLYLDIRRSLIVQSQGGAVSRIDKVEYIGGEISDPIQGKTLGPLGFAFRCKWNLIGSVEHWAHVHQRTNQYEAIFHVEIIDGEHWKITQQQIVDESKGEVRQWRRKITVKQDGESKTPSSLLPAKKSSSKKSKP